MVYQAPQHLPASLHSDSCHVAEFHESKSSCRFWKRNLNINVIKWLFYQKSRFFHYSIFLSLSCDLPGYLRITILLLFLLRHNFRSFQTKHFIFIILYTYIIYTYTQFFKSPRICLHCNYSQKSCTVYFGDACEDTLFQHVFKFQNLTLHWYLTLLLYFRWGYFLLKHSIFTTHSGNK